MASAAVMPTYGEVSLRLQRLMLERGEWCGVPMPMQGLTLHIEPKSPWLGLATVCEPKNVDGGELAGARVINRWWSSRLRSYVVIFEHAGRRAFGLDPGGAGDRARHLINNILVSQVWSVDAEIQAMSTLSTLLKPHMMEAYVLTGTFLESSRRSGLTYVFRRLMPTLALTPRNSRNAAGSDDGLGGIKVLTALCLHPIAYYQESNAGAMVPTDDVLAHLLLMRHDEALFWRRANQHSIGGPYAAQSI